MVLRSLSTTFRPGALLMGALLLSCAAKAVAAQEMLRQPVGKGAYEMVLNPVEPGLFVATSQSRSLDKGGVVYRLDPQTLAVTRIIHNDLKPFGAAVNRKTGVLYFGNTTSSAVTAIDAKTGDVTGRLILDARKRSKDVRPLAPRELVVDENTNTLYIGGLGESSVLWVVDGETLTLRATLTGLGKMNTGLAIDSDINRLYTTNADGEFITIDTASNSVLSRKKLFHDDAQRMLLNISLDKAGRRAFITDSQNAALLVVDTRNGDIIKKVDVPASLAVLFNPVRNEVYVTHRQAGSVSVIDAKTYTVTKTFQTPTHPNSLLLSADGQTLYVSVKQASSRQKEAAEPDDIVRIALQ
ncbi:MULTISPECIES: 7-bladed beta-propeller protein YncE [Tenebrionibacter/Tenebrionicola group]|jgi:YVTN family beta-propeller protein|uniref:YncE family protein n=2 Tax=Tenebrionibacter/Tenebrionicola group TaxID=2969848 RepID=A0A8K0XYB1_9ENTR|nr:MULTISPECIES: YncE family protein [Tenebrionibacter/Tenebrionicola group]MBK4716222.1 YncE family protein [Tenebrionibacter intestinalis]MBV5096878.1 YncE family protein [Tenebrionicola larvae]